MAWYPGATKMELQPESDSQAAIQPTQFIMHSIAAPWTARRMYEYWRDSSNLESHFGLSYNGDLGQYIGTETKADANYRANLRPDGTGAVSIETASNLQHTDPWTDEQVEKLIKLGAWLHERHGIPLRICRTASDPGYGYHRLHSDWSTGGTACPGDARVKQFREVVFPGIVALATGSTTSTPAPEDDMTPEQASQLNTLYNLRAVGPWTYKGTDETKDAYWYQRETKYAVDRLAVKVDALEPVQLTDAQVAAIAGAVATNPTLVEKLAEALADKLAARLAE